MRKIVIIGSSGAGKSTLSLQLGERVKIPVVHLDFHHWQAGWIEPPKDVWRKRVEELVRGDSWIIDGNYSGTLDVRLEACDTVIFMDMPRTLCLWRVMKRLATYRKTKRPDMAEGCFERFDFEFIKYVWNFPNRSRKSVIEKLERFAKDKKLVHLKTRKDVESFLKNVKVS